MLAGRVVRGKEGAEAGVLLHSDGQYSPEKITELLEPLDRDTADIVQGSRMLGGGALRGGMPAYKFIANKALTAVENWAFGQNFAEYHSGYMLYSRRAMLGIPWEKLSNSFDFDLEMIVLALCCGGTCLSHVNDAGFWMVNEYFGMTVSQTLRSWTTMKVITSERRSGSSLAISPVRLALPAAKATMSSSMFNHRRR